MTKSGSRGPRLALLALLALLAGLIGAAALAMLGVGGATHLDNANCAGCHLAGKGVTAQQAGLLIASQEVLCAKCHPASIQMSHPSGFEPKKTPPEGYPLDWKGDLTCSTCHDIHGSGRGLPRGAKAGKELCMTCHDADFFRRMRAGGPSLLVGHLGSGVDKNARTLDVYSLQCMQCHAKNANPRLVTGVDRNGVVRHASQSMNHPIGASYGKAGKFGGYRPRSALDPKLLLPEGKLSCVSCHEGYKLKHGKLVITKEHSALCYACHDL